MADKKITKKMSDLAKKGVKKAEEIKGGRKLNRRHGARLTQY
jgi:hypothetical protein